jgi:hypothetical protein
MIKNAGCPKINGTLESEKFRLISTIVRIFSTLVDQAKLLFEMFLPLVKIFP